MSRHKLPDDQRWIDGAWRKKVYDVQIDSFVWSPLDGQRKEDALFDEWIASTGLVRGDPNLRGELGDQEVHARLKSQHMANRAKYIPDDDVKERLHG